MTYAASRCLVGGSTLLSSTTRGDDVKCSRVNTAVQLLINIVVYSWKQNWQDISGLSAIHSVSELSGHRLYILNWSAKNGLVVPETIL